MNEEIKEQNNEEVIKQLEHLYSLLASLRDSINSAIDRVDCIEDFVLGLKSQFNIGFFAREDLLPIILNSKSVKYNINSLLRKVKYVINLEKSGNQEMINEIEFWSLFIPPVLWKNRLY